MINYLDYNEFKIIYRLNHLYVTNYISIIDVNENEVVIKTKSNIIKIYGSNIRVVKLLLKEVLFSGTFKRIDLDE